MDRFLDEPLLPKVKNTSSGLLADDIIGYDPNNPDDVERVSNQFRKMFEKIKEDFDEKGIPMPSLRFDHSKEPITYGVRTTDSSGNTIHTLI